MVFLNFVFRGFWTFSGFFLLSLIGYSVIKAVFDFIVELIHGKPVIINNPEKIIEAPKLAEKVKKTVEKIDSSVKVDSADVSVMKRK